jgi:glycosyltransferase involved in cell wall biosynthesis
LESKLPFFSIIIPTYHRSQQLAHCLERLAALEYPRDRFEVIVVDDGSKAPPSDVVASFSRRFHVELYTQPHAGPAAARNRGAKQARGEFLAFIDDDTAPRKDWLLALASRFREDPARAVFGRAVNVLLDNRYSTASQLLTDFLCTYYNTDSRQAKFLTSSNLALPLERFLAIEGFDTTFPLAGGEDREFCDRWLSQSYQVTYAEEVKVEHAHPLTLSTFWRQHFGYGRGAFHFHRLRAVRRAGYRMQPEPLTFYLNLVRYPFWKVRPADALGLTLLLGISQVANAAGYFWESFRWKGKARPTQVSGGSGRL